MAHLRPIDKEFEEADDTGVLVLSSRNLRNFPVVPGDLCDFNDLLEAGKTRSNHNKRAYPPRLSVAMTYVHGVRTWWVVDFWYPPFCSLSSRLHQQQIRPHPPRGL